MILEAVYEPRLLESSHGFRPGRSQHTCLKYVRRTFRGVNWFIEGQRSWQCFDTIFNILKILEENIRDQRFIHLIKKGLQAKVILPGGEIESSCACASRKRRRLRFAQAKALALRASEGACAKGLEHHKEELLVLS